MSGGVALNCVANGKLQKEKIFKNIWIQPASGDAGGALGVAQTIYFDHLNNKRKTQGKMLVFFSAMCIIYMITTLKKEERIRIPIVFWYKNHIFIFFTFNRFLRDVPS